MYNDTGFGRRENVPPIAVGLTVCDPRIQAARRIRVRRRAAAPVSLAGGGCRLGRCIQRRLRPRHHRHRIEPGARASPIDAAMDGAAGRRIVVRSVCRRPVDGAVGGSPWAPADLRLQHGVAGRRGFAAIPGGLGSAKSSACASRSASCSAPTMSSARRCSPNSPRAGCAAALLGTLSIAWAGGYACAYFVGYALSGSGPNAWRWMLLSSALPCLAILPLRLTLPESPLWLANQGPGCAGGGGGARHPGAGRTAAAEPARAAIDARPLASTALAGLAP